MDLELAPQDRAFQAEVRAFLEARLSPELRAAASRQAGVFAEGELARTWHRILYEQGWIAPAWPKAYGGTGWSYVQRYIFETECALAGAPVLPAMGLQMCGPVLIGHGTPEQKSFFLPRILSGEHYWCQGYSEPQSGSDLASLQTRAVRDGDDYVVSGSKIWTTHAHVANWIFLLVRTATEGKPQAGITFLLCPLDSPGITVRPILSMSGEHEINQVFFDGVRVPARYRLGQENDGWRVAKHLLEFERGGGAAGARLRGALQQLRRIAAAESSGAGASLLSDPAFRRRLAELETEISAVEFTERRVVSNLSVGANTGDATASMLKLKSSETQQKLTGLALEALAGYAAADQRPALGWRPEAAPIGPPHAATPTARYLNSRAVTIFGGSSEIQRNILARTALGL